MSDKNSQGLPWEHYKKTLKLSCLEDKKHYKFAMGSGEKVSKILSSIQSK